MKKKLIIFCINFLVFVSIINISIPVRASELNQSDKIAKEELNSTQLTERFAFVKNMIDAYHQFKMADSAEKINPIQRVITAVERQELTDDIISNSIKRIEKALPVNASKKTLYLLANKLLYECYHLISVNQTETLLSVENELTDWTIIDDMLVCKIRSIIRSQYSDMAEPSLECKEIQLVVTTKGQAEIFDWYEGNPASFESYIRGYELDLFDSQNWIKNFDEKK